ncbi:mucolipin-3-like [Saccostrea echinata]|uniref:mucolipin-3-like n=1 Tax=Saccostrea echinata TaxID=191078 RepID=UPI002A8184FF|nr:mucolipin-3-like [Saccostrea echinata]
MADNNKELESKEDNSKVSDRRNGHQSRTGLQTINLHRPTGRINELTHMASTNTLPNDIDNTAGQTTEGPTPKKSLKRVASFYTPYMEDRLRRKLKFHFMGPHEKFKAKRKCPWKLVLQIFKVFLVTAQLIMFGYERALFVEYVELNNIAMKHMYLLKWDPSFETMPYPPATGKYAIYKANDLIDHINFAMKQFNRTEELTLGSLRFANRTKYLSMCVEEYREGKVYDNDTYVFDPKVTTVCFDLQPVPVYNEATNSTELQYDLLAILKKQNRTLYFDRILLITLKFRLRSIRLALERKSHEPECFKINGRIVFDDSNKDGQMVVDLFSSLDEFKCSGKFKNMSDDQADKLGQMLFDIFVILVSVFSSFLCIRSLYRTHKLRVETVQFFKTRYRKDLSFYDKFEFVNLWYVLIVINDILTVVGSSFKIQLERRHAQSSSENYDLCALMLGTGSLLVWMGVIRYIGFFKTFNILTVVLKKAFPDMMRFLVTTMMLYLGFMFCGWAVLGPYHIKFRHLSTTSECLFSLVNGDDMFVTFSATVTEDTLVWYYSRIYLYLFVSLFIYAVLNLFIAVILDTYETIKEYYEQGFPKSELFEFIDECEDSPDSELYRGEDQTCSCGVLSLLCCFCCKKSKSGSPTEYTSLLH